ncbi:MAG: hypothetical protein UT86_C0001G0167 [Candidatus Magasanikbacteria bacterium GW2011_GWC2_40_17]|uniref:Cell division protein FtsQ/DivIB C-terminal domain-containing protein n=1 Tax=Candidatus Magasanikbacteria bacterium GW2011_GWA2_42_32 TaxID=1619039 RepID=A0A0G1A902_9BACT|nr:MAG: hypothetical protein UT86_C0001G0167 [Candidatus Magasanikbacteria bacterium GW2011_GWC2_40_17]KKS57527.1 MAG: hypothetical protein UV20_C0001G0167 [Candidatus Magasanikbacteria bacterium GW2011_GWA2_42_32]OGH85242.1 MAG: hypothetical protein A2294_00660 [Candidatus Magasanikbacteria bacterium RIFOXYB2_FULL_38_10]
MLSRHSYKKSRLLHNKFKKRDFLIKKFKNPYFLKDRMPRRTRAPRLKLALGVLSLLGIVIIFLIHPYFLINKIEIDGAQTISEEFVKNLAEKVMSKKRFLFFNGHNIFLVDLNKIKEEIKNKIVLENLDVNSKSQRSLQIKISEKSPKLILQSNLINASSTIANFFSLDSEGKIITEANKSDNLTLPVIIFEKNPPNFSLNNQIISQATIEFIYFLNKNIDKVNNVNISHFLVDGINERVINVQTDEGWKIILDRQNDWQKQVQVLNLLLQEKIKKERKSIKYIDVRYENRSYYQ